MFAIIIIIICSLLIRKHMFLEYGRERNLLCPLYYFIFFLQMSSYLAPGRKKKKIRLFQPALYIACVGLDVLEAALEDYSV